MSFAYHYVMHGRPVAKKNSHRVRFRTTPQGPRAFLGNSREYLEWARDAGHEVRIQRGCVPTIPRDVALRAEVVVYLGKGQRLDSDNALGGPFDVLQSAGVYANDAQIKTHSCTLDRDWGNPRVEVWLTSIE